MTGELLFAIVIGLLASISPNNWVFTAAMLHLSISDGIAAIAGVLWGDNNSYKVFGRTKSLVGSAAFLLSSLIILAAYHAVSGSTTSVATILWLPLVATATENLAVQGTDNLVMPMIIALVLASGV